MVRRFSTLCLCFCAFLQAARAHAEIQVGAASRVITPDPLLPISGGMGVPKPASEKRGELTARAIVIRKAGEALPNIGFYLKRKMHGTQNLLFGLTNDAFGYILTKVDFHSFPRYDHLADLAGRIDRRDPHRPGARTRQEVAAAGPLIVGREAWSVEREA